MRVKINYDPASTYMLAIRWLNVGYWMDRWINVGTRK